MMRALATLYGAGMISTALLLAPAGGAEDGRAVMGKAYLVAFWPLLVLSAVNELPEEPTNDQ